MLSFPECVTWLAVGLTKSVAIVTLNIITIIVFIKNRNLRKRSTYLVMNLAVADMLVAGNATYVLFYFVGAFCNVWKLNFHEGWPRYVLSILLTLFPLCSITNITAISVERLHATLRPFRHRVIKLFVYEIVIAVVWVTAGLLSIAYVVVVEFTVYRYALYLRTSLFAVCLLVICISYSSIVIRFRRGAQPQHHGAASRERKLTMTLLIVTVVSLLLYLPYIIYKYLLLISDYEIVSSMSGSSEFHLNETILVLFFANSLVNPILYAIRMSENRLAVLALFRRRPRQQRQVAVLPLNDM